MNGGYDQDALDAASREVHMMLLREGSSWGTKACEEMGRVFMTAYRKAALSEPPRGLPAFAVNDATANKMGDTGESLLGGYADSYARTYSESPRATVSPNSVAWDIRQNMIPAVDAALKAARPPAAQPPYPTGIVDGPCVCGSWPGGECFKCPWQPAAPELLEALKYARRMVDPERADLAFIDAAITKAEGK